MSKHIALVALLGLLISSSTWAIDFNCPLNGVLNSKPLTGNAYLVGQTLRVDVDYDGKTKFFGTKLTDATTVLSTDAAFPEFLDYLVHSGNENEVIGPLTPAEAALIKKVIFVSDFPYISGEDANENSNGVAVIDTFDTNGDLFARFVLFAEFEIFARCP